MREAEIDAVGFEPRSEKIHPIDPGGDELRRIVARYESLRADGVGELVQPHAVAAVAGQCAVRSARFFSGGMSARLVPQNFTGVPSSNWK